MALACLGYWRKEQAQAATQVDACVFSASDCSGKPTAERLACTKRKRAPTGSSFCALVNAAVRRGLEAESAPGRPKGFYQDIVIR
jgi:hypothetical protein